MQRIYPVASVLKLPTCPSLPSMQEMCCYQNDEGLLAEGGERERIHAPLVLKNVLHCSPLINSVDP